MQKRWKLDLFTFHLFDAAQSVLEGTQGGGLIPMSLLSGQVKLQLFQSFNDLLLSLGFGRLFTAVRGTGPGQIQQEYLRKCTWAAHWVEVKYFLRKRAGECVTLMTPAEISAQNQTNGSVRGTWSKAKAEIYKVYRAQNARHVHFKLMFPINLMSVSPSGGSGAWPSSLTHMAARAQLAGCRHVGLSQEATPETLASLKDPAFSFVIVGLAAYNPWTPADSTASGWLGKHSLGVCCGQMAHRVYGVWARGLLMSVLRTVQPSMARKVCIDGHRTYLTYL